MATAAVRHPIFARINGRMGDAFEAKGNAEHRQELLAGLAGRVIEVGAGTGLNFGHYPPSVTEVVAVEPEPYLRAKAKEAAARVEMPVTVVGGVADRLPRRRWHLRCRCGVAGVVLGPRPACGTG